MPAQKRPTARKRTAARRKKTTTARTRTRTPKTGSPLQRLGAWAAIRVAEHHERHTATTMSRKDAAILRLTHQGCQTCHGNGQIFTKGKDGAFTGSKPCPAKPKTQKVSRFKVAMAARFATDRSAGLIGWTCPCGSKEKPRYRDAKLATKALRAHEAKRHGGQTVGGAWYAEVTEQAALQPSATPTPTKETAVKKHSLDTPEGNLAAAARADKYAEEARAEGKQEDVEMYEGFAREARRVAGLLAAKGR